MGRDALRSLRTATELNPKLSKAQMKLAELMLSSQKKEVLQEAASRLQQILAESIDDPDVIDRLANAEFRLGKTGDAEKRLEESLKKFPSHMHAAVTLARMRLARNDLAGAEQILNKAAADDPQSAAAARAVGQLYLLLGKVDQAEPELLRAVRLDPQDGAALTDLAMVQVAGKRWREADQTYRTLASLADPKYRLVHARFQYRQGKQQDALAELRALFAKDPQDRAARTLLVAWYVEQNQTKEAEDLLAATLKKNPKDTPALYQRSLLSLRSAKLPEAEADLREVLRTTPNSAQTHYALSAVYRAQRQVRVERNELAETLRFDPNHSSARIALSKTHLAAGETKAALQALDAAPAQQQRTASWILARNWVLLAQQDVKQLRSVLNQLLPTIRHPELVLQDALTRSMEKDYAGARASAEEVLRQSPEDTRAAMVLVSSYVALRQPDKAEARLQELVEAHPKSTVLRTLLGRWYMDHAKPAEARIALEAANSADPAFLEADFALAELDRRENRTDAARERLEAIVRLDSANITALLMLAGLEQSRGNPPGAIARFRRVLEIDDSNILALTNLAYLRAPEDPEEAVALGVKALALSPDNIAIKDTLGWIHFRRGAYDAAIPLLKAAADKEPSVQRQFRLAITYVKAGQSVLGKQMLSQAILRDPKLPQTEKDWLR
ncbi:MAG: tetratricopeptide repeat protein [Candidatus Solibacter sp.]|nr:tetratricopeptide repeat protein [Candidatus Solibacter sp.]